MQGVYCNFLYHLSDCPASCWFNLKERAMNIYVVWLIISLLNYQKGKNHFMTVSVDWYPSFPHEYGIIVGKTFICTRRNHSWSHTHWHFSTPILKNDLKEINLCDFTMAAGSLEFFKSSRRFISKWKRQSSSIIAVVTKHFGYWRELKAEKSDYLQENTWLPLPSYSHGRKSTSCAKICTKAVLHSEKPHGLPRIMLKFNIAFSNWPQQLIELGKCQEYLRKMNV